MRFTRVKYGVERGARIVLGIIGSMVGGGVSHMFSRPTNERYHPAGFFYRTGAAVERRVKQWQILGGGYFT